MSEVPEGYVPTTAGNMEYHSITTWRSDSQNMMTSASQTLAAIQTAALPLSTPPPTPQTTVAMSSHRIPASSVLPTLGLQHNDGGKETYRCIYQMHARCNIKLKSCKPGSNTCSYVSVYFVFLVFTCQQDSVNYTQNFPTMQHWNLELNNVTSVRSESKWTNHLNTRS